MVSLYEKWKSFTFFDKVVLISGALTITVLIAGLLSYSIYSGFVKKVSKPDTPEEQSSDSKRKFIVSFPSITYDKCVSGEDPGDTYSMLLINPDTKCVKQGVFYKDRGGISPDKSPCGHKNNTNYFENFDEKVMFDKKLENHDNNHYETLTFKPIDIKHVKEYNLTVDMNPKLRNTTPENFKGKCEEHHDDVKGNDYFDNPLKTTYYRMKLSGRANPSNGKFQSLGEDYYLELVIDKGNNKYLQIHDEKRNTNKYGDDTYYIQHFRLSESRGLLLTKPIVKDKIGHLNEMKAGEEGYRQYRISGIKFHINDTEDFLGEGDGDKYKCGEIKDKSVIADPHIDEFKPESTTLDIETSELGLPLNTQRLRYNDPQHIVDIKDENESREDSHEIKESQRLIDIEPVVWQSNSGKNNCQ